MLINKLELKSQRFDTPLSLSFTPLDPLTPSTISLVVPDRLTGLLSYTTMMALPNQFDVTFNAIFMTTMTLLTSTSTEKTTLTLDTNVNPPSPIIVKTIQLIKLLTTVISRQPSNLTPREKRGQLSELQPPVPHHHMRIVLKCV